MTAGKLEGKVALVTGAGGGIGGAICTLFAAEGAAVLCTDIIDETARTTAAAATEQGRAEPFTCDVSDGASARAAVEAALARFGGLHVLVNGAAVFPAEVSVVDLKVRDWERALAVNISGAFHMSRHAVPVIAESGGGSIIHIASQLGHVGKAGQAAYCTTKGALLAFAKAMALDHASDNIRVNTLSPGGIATQRMAEKWGDMETAEREWGRAKHPLGRLGRVEEVARAALFLASDDSTFMTGADLLVDGGYTAL